MKRSALARVLIRLDTEEQLPHMLMKGEQGSTIQSQENKKLSWGLEQIVACRLLRMVNWTISLPWNIYFFMNKIFYRPWNTEFGAKQGPRSKAQNRVDWHELFTRSNFRHFQEKEEIPPRRKLLRSCLTFYLHSFRKIWQSYFISSPENEAQTRTLFSSVKSPHGMNGQTTWRKRKTTNAGKMQMKRNKMLLRRSPLEGTWTNRPPQEKIVLSLFQRRKWGI